jgi:hypothetical protein
MLLRRPRAHWTNYSTNGQDKWTKQWTAIYARRNRGNSLEHCSGLVESLFLGFPDPDPAPDPDSSIKKQKNNKNLYFYTSVTSYL